MTNWGPDEIRAHFPHEGGEVRFTARRLFRAWYWSPGIGLVYGDRALHGAWEAIVDDFETSRHLGRRPYAELSIRSTHLKAIREALCKSALALSPAERQRIQELVDAIDTHRPLGTNGKHGSDHTPTCGCDPTTIASTPTAPDPTRDALADTIRADVDAVHPRYHPNGTVNIEHVVMEGNLRQRAGLPAQIMRLDGMAYRRPTDPPRPE